MTTVKLSPGIQAAPIVAGKSDITFVSDGGKVIFNSTIKLGDAKNISFNGDFTSVVTDYVVDFGRGNNINISFLGFDFGNTAKAAFNGDPNDWQLGRLLYKGTPDTALFSGLTIDGFKISGRTALYAGTYPDPLTYLNVGIGLKAFNGYVVNDGTGSTVKVSGQSLYGFIFDNWNINGPTNDTTDVGIFFVTGSGQIKNMKRYSGYGYLGRLKIACIDGITFDQSCAVINCLDVNTVLYGTIDVRIEKALLNSKAAIPIRGNDFYFLNNTSGNKADKNNGYVTNAVVAGDMIDDIGTKKTVYIKNSFAYNAYKSLNGADNGSSLLKTNGQFFLSSVNNIDLPPGVPLPAGYLDSNYNPIPGNVLDKNNVGARPLAAITKPQPTITSVVINYSDGTQKTIV